MRDAKEILSYMIKWLKIDNDEDTDVRIRALKYAIECIDRREELKEANVELRKQIEELSNRKDCYEERHNNSN